METVLLPPKWLTGPVTFTVGKRNPSPKQGLLPCSRCKCLFAGSFGCRSRGRQRLPAPLTAGRWGSRMKVAPGGKGRVARKARRRKVPLQRRRRPGPNSGPVLTCPKPFPRLSKGHQANSLGARAVVLGQADRVVEKGVPAAGELMSAPIASEGGPRLVGEGGAVIQGRPPFSGTA